MFEIGVRWVCRTVFGFPVQVRARAENRRRAPNPRLTSGYALDLPRFGAASAAMPIIGGPVGEDREVVK
jgi:hypothetical protein